MGVCRCSILVRFMYDGGGGGHDGDDAGRRCFLIDDGGGDGGTVGVGMGGLLW